MTAVQVPEWMLSGACTGQPDLDLHFPEAAEGTPAYDRQAGRAKRVCETCPVVAECLGYAVRFNIKDGIWGGTTGAERARVRRLVLRRAAQARRERVA